MGFSVLPLRRSTPAPVLFPQKALFAFEKTWGGQGFQSKCKIYNCPILSYWVRQEHKTKDKGIYFFRDSCTGAALLLELSPRKLNYITPQGGTGSSDKTYSHLALISLALNVLIPQSYQRIIHSLLMLGLDFCLLEKEKTFHSQLLTLCSIVSVKNGVCGASVVQTLFWGHSYPLGAINTCTKTLLHNQQREGHFIRTI